MVYVLATSVHHICHVCALFCACHGSLVSADRDLHPEHEPSRTPVTLRAPGGRCPPLWRLRRDPAHRGVAPWPPRSRLWWDRLPHPSLATARLDRRGGSPPALALWLGNAPVRVAQPTR